MEPLSHRSLAFQEAHLKADEERFHAGRWSRDTAAGKIICGLQADLLYRVCCEQGGLFQRNGRLEFKKNNKFKVLRLPAGLSFLLGAEL